jgi:hypothetical protein
MHNNKIIKHKNSNPVRNMINLSRKKMSLCLKAKSVFLRATEEIKIKIHLRINLKNSKKDTVQWASFKSTVSDTLKITE